MFRKWQKKVMVDFAGEMFASTSVYIVQDDEDDLFTLIKYFCDRSVWI